MFKPKNVVLLGSSGIHNVCVCTTHQNFKLLLEAASRIIELNLLLDLKYFSEKILLLIFWLQQGVILLHWTAVWQNVIVCT